MPGTSRFWSFPVGRGLPFRARIDRQGKPCPTKTRVAVGTPLRSERSGIALRLLLGLTVLGTTSSRLQAQVEPPKKLSPTVGRVFQWLPEDTETVIVARSLTLPVPTLEVENPRWQDIGASFAFGDEGGKLLGPLRNRKIECVVSGAKSFEVVSAFGCLRSEACSIIVFENELGDAAKGWLEGLRKRAKAVRSLAGHEVFVFPSSAVMEGGFKQTEWQGDYFVLLDSRTILSATSDRYLESVLKRVKEGPKTRALPDTLPEWKHVDLDAPVWMLRHRPKVDVRARTIGVTVVYTQDGFRVVYLPKLENERDRKRVKENWIPASLLSELGETKDHLKIDRPDDGTVVVSFAGKIDISGETSSDIWLSWQLYSLQAFEVGRADSR